MQTRLRRLAGFSYTGPWRYSLTSCASSLRPLFRDSDLVVVCRDQILRASAECGFDVIAYCFMPTHVHLLAHGASKDARLTDFMRHAKQLSGYHGRHLAGGPVWQSGYYERVLRELEDSRTVAAYIVNNPVRARLVDDAREYPFTGSGVCDRHQLFEYVLDRG